MATAHQQLQTRYFPVIIYRDADAHQRDGDALLTGSA